MNRRTLAWQIAVCLGLAQVGPSASQPGSCTIEGPIAVELAAKKGYGFRHFQERTKGNATCLVKANGEILVVSASASEDGECTFAVFAPPQGQLPRIATLALKSGDGATSYLQRGNEPAAGFSVSLSAPQGMTKQYRIMYVEVDAVEGACDKAEIGGQP